MRRLHPTHSFGVVGPDADDLTAGHLECRAVGPGSPVDKRVRRGGKVLLLGVGQVTNTAIHLAEEYAGVPKAPWAVGLPEISVKLPDGTIIRHQLDTSPSCSTAFGAVEYALRRDGYIRDLRLKNAKLQLMDARAVVATVTAMTVQTPDILLCTFPQCAPCSGARRHLAEAGLRPPSGPSWLAPSA